MKHEQKQKLASNFYLNVQSGREKKKPIWQHWASQFWPRNETGLTEEEVIDRHSPRSNYRSMVYK